MSTSASPDTSKRADLAALTRTVRPALRRGARAAEAPVIAAFAALVARQARRGGLTPRTEAAVLTAFAALVGSQAENGRLSRRTEATIADALRLVPTTRHKRARLSSPAVREIVDQFHRLFYDDKQTWRKNSWRGATTWKSPNDLWLYQEIIHSVRPGLIIETGTAFGGSATYMGWLLDAEGRGQVVSVDIAPRGTPPHPRVTYITGSSTDPEIVGRLKDMIPAGEPVMVILDSDHSEGHVYDELCAYADLVTVGSYLIVEDTNVNGHPAHPSHGPGPMEAARRFLAERGDYVVDEKMHRLMHTLNPEGYLLRV
jgi:cephalosporin hydroxylase